MKKKFALFMALVLMFSLCLSACKDSPSDDNVSDDGSSVTVIPDDSSQTGETDNQTDDDSQTNTEPAKTDKDKDGSKDKDKDTQSTDKEPSKPKPPSDGNNSSDDSNTPDPEPPAADSMNWPSNEYTKLVPRPSAGTVKKTDIQNGIFCLLLTGAEMVDAKAYAGALINAGYTSEVTETIEDGLYLFGGGNSKGSFVVVSYQNGQFIIGIEP